MTWKLFCELFKYKVTGILPNHWNVIGDSIRSRFFKKKNNSTEISSFFIWSYNYFKSLQNDFAIQPLRLQYQHSPSLQYYCVVLSHMPFFYFCISFAH